MNRQIYNNFSTEPMVANDHTLPFTMQHFLNVITGGGVAAGRFKCLLLKNCIIKCVFLNMAKDLNPKATKLLFKHDT